METISIAILILLVALIGIYVLVYNGLARAVTMVDQGWAGIEVQLKRRHDLAPQLVRAVRAAMRHENEIVDRVLASRERAMAALSSHDPALVAASEAEFGRAVSRLIGFTEDNPEITATASLGQFQHQIEETEDQIAAARRLYNGNVQALNARIVTFPGNVVAAFNRFPRATFFELSATERELAQNAAEYGLQCHSPAQQQK